MKRTLLLVLLVLIAGAALWIWMRGSAPPEVPFTKVKRERLESTLETNGKVEPSEWTDVRAETAGIIERVYVDRGQRIAKGALIAALDARDARAELAAAQSRIEQAKAELATIERGGSAAQLAEIDSGLRQARHDRDAAQRDYDVLKRLRDKQAATEQEVSEARLRIERADLQIKALGDKRAALVGQADKSVAQARLKDAEAAAQAAQRKIDEASIRAPIDGTVFNLPARAGAYIAVGDLVAQIGQLDRMRVRVYVDEPELGRVERGMPVTITWDALPGKTWTGTVERIPTQITPLGTRQVGEVICMVENPGRELLPGTNINARIQSKVVESALTIPREALRKQGDQTGVFLLEGDHVVWRPVSTGVTSLTRAEVVGGLKEGDAVALASDVPLKSGDKVRPVFP